MSVKKSIDIYIVIHNQAGPTEGGGEEPLMGFGITRSRILLGVLLG